MKNGGMDMEKRKEMLHMHHMQTLWIYWMLVILGSLACFISSYFQLRKKHCNAKWRKKHLVVECRDVLPQ